jgi:hypothetical protein
MIPPTCPSWQETARRHPEDYDGFRTRGGDEPPGGNAKHELLWKRLSASRGSRGRRDGCLAGGGAMEVKSLEVFAEDCNFGIVRMPGRNSPGCVIQGDSLFILWTATRQIAKAVSRGATEDEEFRGAVEDLHNALLSRLLHYQEVLQREGLDLPYIRPVESGHVRLITEEGGPP